MHRRSLRPLKLAAPRLYYALLAPYASKATGIELGVPNRVLNISVPHIILEGPHVYALVGERIARSVPQHVRVNLEPA